MTSVDNAARNLAALSSKGAPGKKNAQSKVEPMKILVIVENKIYEESIRQLLEKCLIELYNFDIRSAQLSNAKEREKNMLSELRLSTLENIPYSHVLCIADGDDAPNNQFSDILEALQRQGYNTSGITMNENGACFETQDKPRVGIWIMPNNRDKGTFADFYLKSALPDNILMQKIEDVLNKNKKDKLVKYKNAYHGAAKFFTYLAWQKNPSRSDYELFDSKKFNMQNELFINFKKWLNLVIQ